MAASNPSDLKTTFEPSLSIHSYFTEGFCHHQRHEGSLSLSLANTSTCSLTILHIGLGTQQRVTLTPETFDLSSLEYRFLSLLIKFEFNFTQMFLMVCLAFPRKLFKLDHKIKTRMTLSLHIFTIILDDITISV